MSFLMADPPHSVQKDQNWEHTAYDMFALNDVTDMAKMLGDVVSPGAHGHSLCSALQCFFQYKALALEQMEARNRTREDSCEGGSESAKSEIVELRIDF